MEPASHIYGAPVLQLLKPVCIEPVLHNSNERASQLVLVVKKKKAHLPVQETSEIQVQSLSWEDPLEEEMATHSNILVWRIPCTEEPGRATVHSIPKESDTTEVT